MNCLSKHTRLAWPDDRQAFFNQQDGGLENVASD